MAQNPIFARHRRTLYVLAVTSASAACAGDGGENPHTLDAGDVQYGSDTASFPAADVTFAALLDQMVNVERLTTLPNPGYKTRLASSFDRASSSAARDSDAWFANRDFATLTAGEPLVLLDATGPGVITRIWSANPSGTFRVFIDDASTPAIEAPMKKLLSGAAQPFGAPFAFVAGGGYNLYFPIAYQNHCVVTVTSDSPQLYYQIDYRTYEGEISVQPFSESLMKATASERQRIAATLKAPSDQKPAGEQTQFSLSSDPSETRGWHVKASNGGRELSELRIQVEHPQPAALRETILRIEVDGEETVRVPFGDFFGSAAGFGSVHSLSLDAAASVGRFVSRWRMPFAHDFTISLLATSDTRLAADVEATFEDRPWDESSLLFYAQWHPPSWQTSEPSHDWTLTAATGNGIYVGNVLNVINSHASWWGEGDEKIYIDDDDFPSAFGTGTEDYYGFAWCSNELFSWPYVGQTRASPRRNWGAMSMYRLAVLDAKPFSERFRFDLEVNHWGTTPFDVEYDGVVYFYARPGLKLTPIATSPELYRIPEPPVPEPTDVPEGPYACGSG